MITLDLDREIARCRNCRLWCDGAGWPEDQEFEIWTLPNGMTLGVPGVGQIPLHSDYVPCETHRIALEERLTK